MSLTEHKKLEKMESWEALEALHFMGFWPTDIVARWARGYSKAPGAMLEVGCGTGRNLVAFHILGWEVHGLDINPHAVSVAQKRLESQIRLMQELFEYAEGEHPSGFELMARDAAKGLPWKDASFDLVAILSTLQHLDLQGRSMVMTEAGQVLKPGGHMLLSLMKSPHAGAPTEEFQTVIRPSGDLMHWFLWDEVEFLLKQAKVKPTQVEAISNIDLSDKVEGGRMWYVEAVREKG